MRLGRALLVLGPLLVASHLLSDALPAPEADPLWTYTVASYDIAIIITIVGAALTWRAPPNEMDHA